MRYKIIWQEQRKKIESTLTLLEENVESAIAEGWKPLGGVNMTINAKNNNTTFYQSMVKE